MRKLTWIRACAGLALALVLSVPWGVLAPRAFAAPFTWTGEALGLDQRAVLVFDNFSDPEANDNGVPDPDWPGYTGAELALWKAASEWASEPHGLTGAGDPHQPGDLGSGGANFDVSWQGNNSAVGSVNDNTHSELSGNGGGVLAFTETPIGDGWRIRYYADPWIWSDGPDTAGGGASFADLQGVGTHEYGHALGLGHSSDPSATMAATVSGTGIELRSIEADDRAGVQFVYGALDTSVKPHIDLVTSTGGVVTVFGERFDPFGNELWFTKAAVGPGVAGGVVKVTGLTSDGTSISAAIPAAAGPGDVLVKRGGATGFAALSNQMPFAPTSPVRYATALNIDIGVQAGVPGPGQGHAAVSPGVWNGIQPSQSLTPLVDLLGVPVSATITTSGLNGEFSFNNPATTGGAEKLLDDLEDLGCTPGVSSSWTIAGMSAGQYEVFVYSWGPDDPTSYFTQLLVEGGGAGPQVCGGTAWGGAHVEGGTFVRDVVTVYADGGAIRVTATTMVGCGSVNGIQIVPAMGCGPVTAYCSAGTSASGCVPALGGNGTPSASATAGFALVASGVEGDKDGLFFWGINGRQANPWGNGTSFQCVAPPVWRGGLLKGTGTSGACDGTFTQDLNALWCSACPKPNKNPGPGTLTQAQLWYRDPQSTSNQTTSLSNAVEFAVCP